MLMLHSLRCLGQNKLFPFPVQGAAALRPQALAVHLSFVQTNNKRSCVCISTAGRRRVSATAVPGEQAPPSLAGNPQTNKHIMRILVHEFRLAFYLSNCTLVTRRSFLFVQDA